MKRRFESPNILELGPGSGLDLKHFEDNKIKTVAIDFSFKILEAARKTSPETEFLAGDFLKFDFGNRQFDGIFAKAFIHLFPRPDAEEVFEKVRELLDEDGLFYISTTVLLKEDFSDGEVSETKSLRFRKKWTEEELVEILEKKNFRVIEKIHTDEKAFGKEWVVLILEKF